MARVFMTLAKVPKWITAKQARIAYVAAYNSVIDKGGSDRAARIAAEKEGKRVDGATAR